MELFDIFEKRRSIRAFLPKPVETEKIEKILQAINLAPSAGNLQAFEVFLITRSSKREGLAQAALGQEFIASAPVILVFCAHAERSAIKYGDRGQQLYTIQDATIACTFAMLAAVDLGLGSVWVGAFHEEAARQALNLQTDLRPVAMLPVGYPAEEPAARSRRPLEEIIHRS